MQDFFAMGGYAIYLWPSYLAFVLALGGNAWLAWRGRRKTLQQLHDMMEDEGRS